MILFPILIIILYTVKINYHTFKKKTAKTFYYYLSIRDNVLFNNLFYFHILFSFSFLFYMILNNFY